MSNIFINGLKAKCGGGKSILNNYLSLLRNSKSPHRFFVLTPDKLEYEKYNCGFIQIVEVPNVFTGPLLFPLLYLMALPRLMRAHKIDLIFNLGDIPIPSNISQVYLFDWSYAVYPESVVWKKMDTKSFLIRRVKLFVFKRWIGQVTAVIAQTEAMKRLLVALYGLENVTVIPNAVSLENMGGGKLFDFDLSRDKTKLLYLTYYYPHKNLEIFLLLARKIKEMTLPYCLVVTIDATQHSKAEEFLNTVWSEELQDIIINVGPVPMDNVPSLYTQCDALLMPTLLESFSGTYVEAMYHQKTILTSDLDFARDVCGDAAYYFDPLDSDSILSAITLAFEEERERDSRIEKGRMKLDKLLNWAQAFDKFQVLLEDTIDVSGDM